MLYRIIALSSSHQYVNVFISPILQMGRRRDQPKTTTPCQRQDLNQGLAHLWFRDWPRTNAAEAVMLGQVLFCRDTWTTEARLSRNLKASHLA